MKTIAIIIVTLTLVVGLAPVVIDDVPDKCQVIMDEPTPF